MSGFDKLAWQREYRKLNKWNCKKYEKTQNGFLMRVYRNMKSRVSGIQKLKHHLYKDKYLLSKEEFYKWANNSQEFLTLFKTWEASNYERKITPSVDRIDSSLGYELSNMRWVTHSFNSRMTSKNINAWNRKIQQV